MPAPPTVPAAIRVNDEAIARALAIAEQSDSALASALFESESHNYYRVFGYKSLAAYLRERWEDTELAGTARLKARSIQRLIREYKLAREIPAFMAAFDRLSRSNRRVIAQVITRENAEEWIEAGLHMTARELERRIAALERGDDAPARRGRLYLSLYQGQREVWERAKGVARDQAVADGVEPESLTDAMILEQLCAEFIGAHDGVGTGWLAECPACGKLAPLRRMPGDGDVDADGQRVRMYGCVLCAAPIAVVGRTSPS